MPGELTMLLFALDLVALAGLCWAAMLRKWRIATGCGVALLGSLPMLRLALAGEFSLAALLVLLAALGGGAAIALMRSSG